MRHIFLFASVLFLVSGCVSTDHVWIENVDGNQLKIMQQHSDFNRVIHVENTNRTWVGKFSGGEEKVAERKEFLTSLGKQEALKVCAPEKPTEDDNPAFVMEEDNPMAYGGGILGYAIAAAMADYKNLPTAMYYRFTCPKDAKSDAE